MNDEATRKFIQALKRMMTFCQRRYPTDPSRSVDFDGGSSQGRGAMGGGSDKLVGRVVLHSLGVEGTIGLGESYLH